MGSLHRFCPIEQEGGMSGTVPSNTKTISCYFKGEGLLYCELSNVRFLDVNVNWGALSIDLLVNQWLCPIEQAGEISGGALSNMKTVSCYFK